VLTIRLRKNGPYVVESDDVRVIDWNGGEYATERRPIALCRCGASANKPFCDGTHAKIGFDGGLAVAPDDSVKPTEP
jgi:3-phenylpropionate/trans-cinnamate dioxygenase ferredoxin subunit